MSNVFMGMQLGLRGRSVDYGFCPTAKHCGLSRNNLTPFVPLSNEGSFGHVGVSGIIR